MKIERSIIRRDADRPELAQGDRFQLIPYLEERIADVRRERGSVKDHFQNLLILLVRKGLLTDKELGEVFFGVKDDGDG